MECYIASPRLASELLRSGGHPVSPRETASTIRALGILRGFGLPAFQLRLAKLCGFSGIRSRLQRGLLEEISPALMPVGRVLFGFEILQRRFCVGSSLDDLNHSRGLISTDVVTDYNVRSLKFFVCQMVSLFSPKPDLLSEYARKRRLASSLRIIGRRKLESESRRFGRVSGCSFC